MRHAGLDAPGKYKNQIVLEIPRHTDYEDKSFFIKRKRINKNVAMMAGFAKNVNKFQDGKQSTVAMNWKTHINFLRSKAVKDQGREKEFHGVPTRLNIGVPYLSTVPDGNSDTADGHHHLVSGENDDAANAQKT